MNLEKLWYESSPYLFGLVAIVAMLYSGGSALLKASGLLLFAASVTTIALRFIWRRQQLGDPDGSSGHGL